MTEAEKFALSRAQAQRRQTYRRNLRALLKGNAAAAKDVRAGWQPVTQARLEARADRE